MLSCSHKTIKCFRAKAIYILAFAILEIIMIGIPTTMPNAQSNNLFSISNDPYVFTEGVSEAASFTIERNFPDGVVHWVEYTITELPQQFFSNSDEILNVTYNVPDGVGTSLRKDNLGTTHHLDVHPVTGVISYPIQDDDVYEPDGFMTLKLEWGADFRFQSISFSPRSLTRRILIKDDDSPVVGFRPGSASSPNRVLAGDPVTFTIVRTDRHTTDVSGRYKPWDTDNTGFPVDIQILTDDGLIGLDTPGPVRVSSIEYRTISNPEFSIGEYETQFTVYPEHYGNSESFAVFISMPSYNDDFVRSERIPFYLVVDVDTPPTANPGHDQTVSSNTIVSLDASRSSDDNGIQFYTWTRTGGTGDASLFSPNPRTVQSNVGIIPGDGSTSGSQFLTDNLADSDQPVTHEFELEVADYRGQSHTAPNRITITVDPPPNANAGSDQVVASSRPSDVLLDGSGSTDNGGPGNLSYLWERIGGTSTEVPRLRKISDSQSVFDQNELQVSTEPVTHIYRLTVTDIHGNSDEDTVEITVFPDHFVDAGPDQVVDSDSEVILDGTFTTVLNSPFTYEWTRIGGTSTESPRIFLADQLQGAAFAADDLSDGADSATHIFRLTVTNTESGLSVSDTVSITVDAPPRARFDRILNVASNTVVTLDGSQSIDDDAITEYTWTRSATGTGDASLFSPNPANGEVVTFTSDNLSSSDSSVNHRFVLEVEDTRGQTDDTRFTVNVIPPPDANAGTDQVVRSSTNTTDSIVTLNGSESTSIGTLTYSWERVGGTGALPVVLNEDSTANTTFTADALAQGGTNVTHIFRLTVTDTLGQSDTDDVTITVDAPPRADAGDTDTSVPYTSIVTLDGSASSDGNEIVTYLWERVSGTGSERSFPRPMTGETVTFLTDILRSSDPDRSHVFRLTVTDALGQSDSDEVTLTVEAPENPPTVNAGPNQTVNSGGMVNLAGSGNIPSISDEVLAQISPFVWSRIGGTDGRSVTFTDNTGPQTNFIADNLGHGSENITHILRLRLTNPLNTETVFDDVTITIDAPPEAEAGTNQSVISGQSVTLDGSASNDSSGENVFYSWIAPSGVTLVDANTANPTFTADALQSGAEPVEHIFTLEVEDSRSQSHSDTVTITVNPPDVTTAEAGANMIVDSGTSVTLEGSGNTPNGNPSYNWTAPEGVTLRNENSATTTFTAATLTPGSMNMSYMFTLTVTNSFNNETATDTVTITVDAPPLAEAGPNQVVASGIEVTLDGSGSIDHDGSTEYSWIRTGVTPDRSITLLNPNTESPTFYSDVLRSNSNPVRHEFTLTVRDSRGQTHTDIVAITVEPPLATTANAGPDQIVNGDTMVSLAGSGTAPGGTASYDWIAPVGVNLLNADSASPTFISDDIGSGGSDLVHVFSLTVTNSLNDETATDDVTITIDAPPLSNAGPDQNVASGSTVTLDGSSSVDAATYSWSRLGGTSTSIPILSDENSVGSTFVADILQSDDVPVTHIFELLVIDARDQMHRDTVTITISPPDPTTANAGDDQSVVSGDTVTLEGSGTGPGTIGYEWVAPDGIGLSNINIARPTFTSRVLNPGENNEILVFELTVSNSLNNETATDEVTIIVDAPPLADAGGDRTVTSGSTVTLDGGGSRDNTGAVNYRWERTGGTSGRDVVLSEANIESPTFAADVLLSSASPVSHIFTLTVTDSRNQTHSDTVNITVAPPAAPTVNAGINQVVDSGATVTLDGSGNTPVGTASYAWSRSGGTEGGHVAFANANDPQTTFTADTLGYGDADVIHELTLTVTNSFNGDTSSDTVIITVDAPPSANAGQNAEFASGSEVTLNGGLSRDASGGIDYTWSRTGGTSGASLTLSDASVENPTFMAQALRSGIAPVEHIFTLVVEDSRGQSHSDTVTITINPPAATTANAGQDQTVASGSTVTLEGSGTAPSGNASYSWSRTGGNGGAVTLSDANIERPTFTADTLDIGDPSITYVFTLTVTNSFNGETAQDEVTVTVDAPPMADAGNDQIVASGSTVTLDGSSSTTGVAYYWERTGGTGDVSISLSNVNFAAPTFTADLIDPGDASVTHVFTLRVFDTLGQEATDTVEITVNPQPPVAEAGDDQSVTSGDIVMLTSAGSTGSGSTYAWARTDGTSTVTPTLSDPNDPSPTFSADALLSGASSVTHEFTLTVTDHAGQQTTDTVTITIDPPGAPTANAGGDQIVASGATVTLSGSGTAPGGTANYEWSTTASGVTISDANSESPTFDAPTLAPGSVDQDLVFTLTVTNSLNLETATDTVTITVDAPPEAEAGPNQPTVAIGSTVTLDGTGSNDHRSGALTYTWARTGGAPGRSVTLSDAYAASPAFTADTLQSGAPPVPHVFTLTVTDTRSQTDDDMVMVTVNAPAAPTADAGQNRVVDSGQTGVTLSGSGTVPSGGAPIYAWTTTASGVTIDDPDAASTTFDAPTLSPGTSDRNLVFTLTVTNPQNNEAVTDTVTITVDAPPLAEAGPDQPTVISGETVTLNGTGSSDMTGGISTYSWARTSGTGDPSVTLSDGNIANPTFTADSLQSGAASVTHIFTLTVTDGRSQPHTDTVTITVNAPGATTANAGNDQIVASGATVTLTGSGNTPGGTPQYAWTQSGGSGGSLANEDEATATFTAPTVTAGSMPEMHEFTLSVTNSLNMETATDTVMVTVNPEMPTAEAGPDQNVASGATVTLTSAGSTTGSGVTYAWAAPPGVALTSSNSATASFTADILQSGAPVVTHIFSLTLRDSADQEATDTVTITINAPDPTTAVAQASPTTVASGGQVTLTGTGTAPGGTASYAWTRTSGTGGTITNADAAMATFDAPTVAAGAQPQTIELTLTVTNSLNSETETDTVTITVNPDMPVAEAGPDQNVASGASVTLTSAGSTGGSATYAWARTGGTQGGTASLSATNVASPTFTADTLQSTDTTVTHEFTLTVRDLAGQEATDTVTVTVDLPTAPTASAGSDDTVDSGQTGVTLTGSGSVPGGGTPIYAWATASGVTLANDDTPSPSFDAPTLAPGSADQNLVFTLTVTNPQNMETATDTVIITVDAPPMAEAGPDQPMVTIGAMVTLNGSGSSDNGGGTLNYAWVRTGGTLGRSVSLSDASAPNPTFTADILRSRDRQVTHEFTLTVTDSRSQRHTDTVTITINLPGATTADAGPDQIVDSGQTGVMLSGSGTAPSGTANYEWTTTASDVTLSATDVESPSFTAPTLAPGSADRDLIFTLRVTNSLNSETTTDTVTITVDAPPLAEAGTNQSVASGAMVTLDGNGSRDRSSGINSYAWVRTGGTSGRGVNLRNADTAQPMFEADVLRSTDTPITHIFTLMVSDRRSQTHTDTVTVTITPPSAPIADAGTGQTVDSGQTGVQLTGIGTVPVGVTPTYAWTTTASGVTIDDPDAARTTFDAPTLTPGSADKIIVFTLTVRNPQNNEVVSDTVTITVDAPPMAEAGSDQPIVVSGETVTLDGTGSSDHGGGPLTYSWARTGGTSTVTPSLNGASTHTATFTADTLQSGATSVTHIFTLTVTDTRSQTSTDTVTITINAPDATTANAGDDQIVVSGATVTLAGSGNAPGGTASYAWRRTGGTGATSVFPNPVNTQTASFTAETLPYGGNTVTHLFTLTVTGPAGATATDTVMITVDAPPLADAGGDRTVNSGGTMSLDGGGSRDDKGPSGMTHQWERTGGTGDAGVFPNARTGVTQTVNFETLMPRSPPVTHVFTLTVMDARGQGSMDMVTVTVNSPGTTTADAGPDQIIDSGDTVSLTGSGTAPGGVASYAWTRIAGTGGTWTDATTATATFVAPTLDPGDANEDHVFMLTVTNSSNGDTATDTVRITVSAPPFPLMANAGEDQTVTSGATVTLDGSASTGTIDSFVWTQTGGPSVTITDANAAIATFTAPIVSAGTVPVELTFRLALTGIPASDTDEDTVTVTVTPRRIADPNDPIREPVYEFLKTRGTLLLSYQPDLSSVVRRPNSRNLNFEVTGEGRLSGEGEFYNDSFWMEVKGFETEDKSSSGDYGFLAVGANFSNELKNSHFGLMAQFDKLEKSLDGDLGSIEGIGWMIGPYAVSEYDVEGLPIHFSGSALYGQTQNDIYFNDGGNRRTGSFDTTRILSEISLTAELTVEFEDRLVEMASLLPYSSFSFLGEHADRFTDSEDRSVLGQNISTTQFDLGMRFEVPLNLKGTILNVRGGKGMILSNANSDFKGNEVEARGKVELGFTYDINQQWSVGVDAFYDGLYKQSFGNWGANLNLEVKFWG